MEFSLVRISINLKGITSILLRFTVGSDFNLDFLTRLRLNTGSGFGL